MRKKIALLGLGLCIFNVSVHAEYQEDIFYTEEKEKANWWYDDGETWYFFQDGIKHTGYAQDNSGEHYFVDGKYANWWHDDGEAWYFFQDGIKHTGYASDNSGRHYFDEGKYANWWHDDGEAWYFFQDGIKHTGYASDSNGKHYFDEGKYANWWNDGGEAWYFFQDGIKHTGYASDNNGRHYFDEGKYANWWNDDGEAWYFFQNGIKHTGYASDNSGRHYFDEGKYANWWHDDGEAWYFFQDGIKHTGYASDGLGEHYFVNGKYANGQYNGTYFLDGKKAQKLNIEIDYLSQRDERWGYKRYGSWTLEHTGCVPTSVAMIINGLKQTNVAPNEVAYWLWNNTDQFNYKIAGASDIAAQKALEHWGIKTRVITSVEQLEQALKLGHPVHALVGDGDFISYPYTHAIVLNHYENGKTYAFDPYRKSNNGWYNIKRIWNQRSFDEIDNRGGMVFIESYR